MRPNTYYVQTIQLGKPTIVPPYNFEYQLNHYVIYPETRVGDRLVEVFRLNSGELLRVQIASRGSIDEPSLELMIEARRSLSRTEVDEAIDKIRWYLGLTEDLNSFYEMIRDDPVLQASVSLHYGAKDKASFSVLESLIGCVCAQNVLFKRLYAMVRNLCSRFGSQLTLGSTTHHAFPTAQQLAEASLKDIRACQVGYRDRYIKGIAEAVASGRVDPEVVRKLPTSEGREKLMELPGVGPYTADMTLAIACRRKDVFFLDSYARKVLRQFYFDGEPVSDDILRQFVHERWSSYEMWALGLLTTNTEIWAQRLGIKANVKSGARS